MLVKVVDEHAEFDGVEKGHDGPHNGHAPNKRYEGFPVHGIASDQHVGKADPHEVVEDDFLGNFIGAVAPLGKEDGEDIGKNKKIDPVGFVPVKPVQGPGREDGDKGCGPEIELGYPAHHLDVEIGGEEGEGRQEGEDEHLPGGAAGQEQGADNEWQEDNFIHGTSVSPGA